jgi:hypothetical protein
MWIEALICKSQETVSRSGMLDRLVLALVTIEAGLLVLVIRCLSIGDRVLSLISKLQYFRLAGVGMNSILDLFLIL